MKMNKLTSLLLAATLGLASGAALAADTGAQSNNGQANSAADAGQVAPDARENVAPNKTRQKLMVPRSNQGGMPALGRAKALLFSFYSPQNANHVIK